VIRSTRLEVDLDAVAHNLSELRAFLEATHVPSPRGATTGKPAIAAVVKADAYGLGARRVARELAAGGVDMLAVACLPEALELTRLRGSAGARAIGDGGPRILVMGHTPDDGLEAAVSGGIRLTIFDLRQAKLLSGAARSLGTAAKVHLKIDTGMNRLGIKPDSETPELIERIASLPGLEIEGIFTHLALLDAESDRRQFDLFMDVVEGAEARGLRFAYRHVCDSLALARYPEFRLDLVRPGALLYGARPTRAPLADDMDLRVPFAFRTRISRLRRIGAGEGVGYDFTWRAPRGGASIATLPVGYVDGYRRCLSNRGEVAIRGRRAKVVGIICMDQLVVDVTGIPDAEEGDDVLLFGTSGDDEIGLAEVASWADTNRNEIVAAIGRRVPRVYLKDGAVCEIVDYLASGGEGDSR
jgi:alanine racemase